MPNNDTSLANVVLAAATIAVATALYFPVSSSGTIVGPWATQRAPVEIFVSLSHLLEQLWGWPPQRAPVELFISLSHLPEQLCCYPQPPCSRALYFTVSSSGTIVVLSAATSRALYFTVSSSGTIVVLAGATSRALYFPVSSSGTIIVVLAAATSRALYLPSCLIFRNNWALSYNLISHSSDECADEKTFYFITAGDNIS